jgi:hypothetical protein
MPDINANRLSKFINLPDGLLNLGALGKHEYGIQS